MDLLKSKINAILKEKASTRTNGRVASERTKSAIGEHVHASFNHLNNLGYKLKSPENIGDKHIEALCTFWYDKKYSPKTIQSNLSYLRIFCRWMGKGEMVKSAPHYLPNVPKQELKVKTVTLKSKSWAANGIDVVVKVLEADALDRRFGMMLRMAVSFGLRAHETVELCPWTHDYIDRLSPTKTKNSRARDIFIHTPEQRIILDYAKSMVKRNEHLGWTTRRDGKGGATLEYSLGRWYRMLAKIGITKEDNLVTGHGLRAQYAENAALLMSVIPPSLGGTGGQMLKEDLDVKRAQVSELLGHSRVAITGAYYGTFGRNNAPDSEDRTKLAIEAAKSSVPQSVFKDIPVERIEDCLRLTAELMKAGAYVEPRLTQVLWEDHSRRHCVEWLVPGTNNIAALETAANMLSRSV